MYFCGAPQPTEARLERFDQSDLVRYPKVIREKAGIEVGVFEPDLR
jgi:hypothetical protein